MTVEKTLSQGIAVTDPGGTSPYGSPAETLSEILSFFFYKHEKSVSRGRQKPPRR